jgi:hypothetical protein
MSFFSWIKGGADAATKVLDAGINGLDALVLTDEEKIQYRQKLADNWVELQKTLGEETTVRGITRRLIALLFVASYVALILIAAALYLLVPEYSKFLIDLAEGKFGWIVLTVVGFYFGPYMIQKALQK